MTVRESAAHAWVRVWVDEAWRDFDPTPSGSLEGDQAPLTLWERVKRLVNDLRFGWSRWWWVGEKRLLRQAYWLALPLLAGLLWRLRRIREASGAELGEGPAKVPRAWPGDGFGVVRPVGLDGEGRVVAALAGAGAGMVETAGGGRVAGG